MAIIALSPLRLPRLAAALLLLALRIPPAPAFAGELELLNDEQRHIGVIALFDGETLFGWTPTSNANWKVEDGAITVSEGEPGFLVTNAEFSEYQLDLQFKAADRANSGVFLQTPIIPTDPAVDCYELNIAPLDNPFPTGSLVGRKRLDDKLADAVEKLSPDGWRSFRVSVANGTVTVWMDGFRRYEYKDRRPLRRGRISLQFREGPVAFRGIHVKPLNLEPMLNGRDLSGWNATEKRASAFEVTENGELHVTGGSGQLETDASYGDFTLQFDCRVDGDGLNSGVFFRCIPRQYMQGYECQISNKAVEGDPTQPADFGTGAIYRRVPARRLVAKDHEWFTTTVNAVGPHIAVWVNGYQVTDWIDARPPDENPRAGLRTAPGTIAIQGHDPTTNLRFRNFRIRELSGRQNDQ